MMNFLKEINTQSANGKSLRRALKSANKKFSSFLDDQAPRQIGRLEGCNELLKDVIEDKEVASAGQKRKRG